MSVWVDTKYLKQISYQLNNWTEKKISPHHSMCRCPLCGDSKKNDRKRRGNFYEKDGKLLYTCFNCGVTTNFANFLKQFDPFLFKQYAFESFSDAPNRHVKQDLSASDFRVTSPKPQKTSILDNIKLVNSLPDDHIAKIYIKKRLIPDEYSNLFYYTDTFFSWASTNCDRFSSGLLDNDHPRIIIPWFNKEGEIFAYQARSLHGQEPKYYTIVLDPTTPKFFGLDRVDLSKTIYVIEGPIDAMFLPNCVAVGSSALTTFAGDDLDIVYVYDAEPRNHDIVHLIEKAVRSCAKVFIPPKGYNHKDLNEAIQSGVTKTELKYIIDHNTYSGALALLKFNMWKRS